MLKLTQGVNLDHACAKGTNGMILLGRSPTFIISYSQEGPTVTGLAKRKCQR